MIPWLARNWFIFVLVGLLAVGIGLSSSLAWLNDLKWLRYVVVAVVMFLMAFPTEASALWASITRPWASLLAVVINYGALPLTAWAISFLLTDDLLLRTGLLIAAATPCTLASAAVWTQRAEGNAAAALLVTMITNVLCFVLTPAWLLATTSQNTSFSGDKFGEMVFQLGALVVAPMVLAQLVRLIPPVGAWATEQRVGLNIAAMSGVLFMVFFGAIESGLKLNEMFSPDRGAEAVKSHTSSKADAPLAATKADAAPVPTSQMSVGYLVGQVALMIACVLAVHLSMVWLGWWISGQIGLSREDQVAVAFAGSQKTLMVGLWVAVTYFPQGLSMLPMVTYHCGQLICDSFIAEWWATGTDPAASNEKDGTLPESDSVTERQT